MRANIAFYYVAASSPKPCVELRADRIDSDRTLKILFTSDPSSTPQPSHPFQKQRIMRSNSISGQLFPSRASRKKLYTESVGLERRGLGLDKESLKYMTTLGQIIQL